MVSAFEKITKGLNEAIEFEKGNKKLKTNQVEIPDLPQLSSKEIRKIRKNNGITQKTFAKLIGVSEKTVEAWETGTNQPSGPAIRVISLYAAGFLDNLLKIHR